MVKIKQMQYQFLTVPTIIAMVIMQPTILLSNTLINKYFALIISIYN
jgi:hypothetical protein